MALRVGGVGAFCVLLALVLAACTDSTAPAGPARSQPAAAERQAASPTTGSQEMPTATVAVPGLPATPTTAAEATPRPGTPTSSVVQAAPATAAAPTVPAVEATATSIGPTASPVGSAQQTTTSPTAPAAGAVSPPVSEATAPASAEVGGASVAAPAAASPRPAGAQPLPLHPFQPAGQRARLVVLDPGHGGSEVGAAGAGVGEKDVNLAIARRLQSLLERDGLRVVLTRDADRRAFVAADGKEPPGYAATRLDLQARVDIANEARADAFISIHNNGSGDRGQSGTEVWYDGKRPFADYNRALAEQVLPALVDAIRATGYPVADRGLKEDSSFRTFRGRVFPIFVLGPPRTGSTSSRAGQMPAILGETLFLSHPVEAELLQRDAVLAAIAAGYRTGLLRYFRLIDDGVLNLPSKGLPPEVPNHYDLPLPGGEAPTPGPGS